MNQHSPANETDHVYDGIMEYDNPLPAWWVWTFWVTVAFAIGYLIIYHVASITPGVEAAYKADLDADQARRRVFVQSLKPDAATLMSMMKDPQAIERGRIVFRSYCVACHGQEAQGLVGPNLTDDRYKLVRRLEDIPHLVAEGTPGGTMPPWKSLLDLGDQIQVAAYVASLRGTNVTGPRPPEGEEIPPWSLPSP